jgi:hypothetical protein
LLNRFLSCACERSRLLPEGETFDELTTTPEWTALQKRFKDNIDKAIAKAADAPLLIRRSAEAQRDWGLNDSPGDVGLYQKLSQPRPGILGEITARAPQQVLRLSLIQAIINGSLVIETDHQDAAWECWRYADDSCRFIWGHTDDPTAIRILGALRNSVDGLTRTDVHGLFFNREAKGDIDSALAWLAQQGLAHLEIQPTGGRPTEKWVATL